MREAMNIIDLSHPITPTMPVYPGTQPPLIQTRSSLEDAGFMEKRLSLSSHVGTHVDAPAHLLKGGKTLDMLPLEQFFGRALNVDVSGLGQPFLGIQDLEPYLEAIRQAEFILLQTGWSRHWGSSSYYAGYPVLSREAAEWLSGFGLKGFGMDTMSVDSMDSEDLPVHRSFLQKETILIENLTSLAAAPGSLFLFSCFPLKLEEADGSPVRAVAYAGPSRDSGVGFE
jgi:kynurenine formamidase